MAIEEVGYYKCRKGLRRALTSAQEFSIEIPDKEADAIHSGTTCHSITRENETLTNRSKPSGGVHPGAA